MYVNRYLRVRQLLSISGWHLLWLTAWAVAVTALYEWYDVAWLAVPWLPLSVIGTAVAFYVGFKNNQSYDRLWEARKIWGAIVNSSRAWGAGTMAMVTDEFAREPIDDGEVTAARRRLVYRHVAWLYALRNQLLVPQTWEHRSDQGRLTQRIVRKMDALGFVDDGDIERRLRALLPPREWDRLIAAKNTATQIIAEQSRDLARLYRHGMLNDFRHVKLQAILDEFYDHQGKCERIKKFPLPRQYAGMSNVFVGVFIFLLPFGMASAFSGISESGHWLAVPFTVLIAWVYLMMELVGDYSENPFQGLGNDIPTLSLTRTIEIDLREMLGEVDLPAPIEARDGVLV